MSIATSESDAIPLSSSMPSESEQRRGFITLFVVYIMWGLLPIYWKQLTHVPPIEVLCHRSFWGFFLVLGLLWLRGGIRGGLAEILAIVKNRRSLMFMTGCSFVHMFGWGFYIWAISAGRIVEASLGQYILPLLSVLFGYLLFKERPRRAQWISIGIAGVGVAGMVLWYGTIPWVGLLSAASAVLFAILRKHAPVNAISGLALEMTISAPILWGYLLWLTVTGQGVFGNSLTFTEDLWLIGAGVVTVIPQMGYAFGLCRVPLTTLSLLQYINPTGNFLVGLFLFGEHFTPDRVFGFTCIWIGLALFTYEGWQTFRGKMRDDCVFPPVQKKIQ